MKSQPTAIDDLRDPRYGSHLVPLAACLATTNGPVLEIGIGHWSTPFLRRYCLAAERKLVSLEADAAWAHVFKMRPIDYDEAVPRMAKEQWSIVLVDHWPESRRAQDALAFVGRAKHILIHDYEVLARKGFCPDPPAGWCAQVKHETLVLTDLDRR